jgi:hydrogenase nickel incorporation protein HypA/HybF
VRRGGGAPLHERHLIEDLVRAVDAAAAGGRPVRIRVRLGALSHLTPEHFREHLADTPLAGVAVDFGPVLDPRDPRAQSVLLESVTLER